MKKIFYMIKGVVIAMSMVGIVHADTTYWTGIYTGVNAGFNFNDAKLSAQQLGFTAPNPNYNMSSDYSTLSSGMQLGYLYQFPNAVVSGVEVNATINQNQTHTFSYHSEFNPAVYDGFTFRNQMQTSIRGRLGHPQAWHNQSFLPYLTAGASVANVGLTYQNESGDYYSKNTTQLGWLVGAGVEWAYTQHWSLRAEYHFVDYGKMIKLDIPTVYLLDDPNGHAKVNLSAGSFVLGVSYWV